MGKTKKKVHRPVVHRSSAKHTVHSTERAVERVPEARLKQIRIKLRKQEYIGLPRQSLNAENKHRCLMEVDGELMVAVWTRRTGEILTVTTLPMYLEGHCNELEPRLLSKIYALYPEAFSDAVKAKIIAARQRQIDNKRRTARITKLTATVTKSLVADAADDNAWEEPIQVPASKPDYSQGGEGPG